MIARFEPIHNTLWYDVRQFDLIDWKVKNLKWLTTDYYRDIKLPTFLPLGQCASRKEFYEQFKEKQDSLF